MSVQRLDKILCHEGFGTRKSVRKILRDCEVLVNGKRITDAGFGINPDKDSISIDGEELLIRKNVYLMMNKISGVVSANKDGLHQTAFDFLDDCYRTPYFEEHLHLVGRLDIDTEGLLLFTTDGALTHRITSPKTHFPKSYFVRLKNPETNENQEKIAQDFKDGIEIPPEGNELGFLAKPAEIQWKSENECILTINEGKFHQVKRMFLAEANEVVYLKRVSIGPLKLDENLAAGEYRELTDEEIDGLMKA